MDVGTLQLEGSTAQWTLSILLGTSSCGSHRGLGRTDGCRASQALWPLLLQSQDSMAAALACSKILKELAKEEEDTDTTDAMLALAEQYEQKAIGEQEGTGPTTALTLYRAVWLCPGQDGWAERWGGWCPRGTPSSVRIIVVL